MAAAEGHHDDAPGCAPRRQLLLPFCRAEQPLVLPSLRPGPHLLSSTVFRFENQTITYALLFLNGNSSHALDASHRSHVSHQGVP